MGSRKYWIQVLDHGYPAYIFQNATLRFQIQTQTRCSEICVKMDMKHLTFGKDRYHLHKEMIQWAEDNIGTGGWRKPDRERWGDSWGIVINFGNQDWYFVDEHDATLFALRWQ